MKNCMETIFISKLQILNIHCDKIHNKKKKTKLFLGLIEHKNKKHCYLKKQTIIA